MMMAQSEFKLLGTGAVQSHRVLPSVGNQSLPRIPRDTRLSGVSRIPSHSCHMVEAKSVLLCSHEVQMNHIVGFRIIRFGFMPGLVRLCEVS